MRLFQLNNVIVTSLCYIFIMSSWRRAEIHYINWVLVPYFVLMNCWRKLFSVTLQSFHARLIIQACLVLFDNGGGNFERDFSSVLGSSF